MWWLMRMNELREVSETTNQRHQIEILHEGAWCVVMDCVPRIVPSKYGFDEGEATLRLRRPHHDEFKLHFEKPPTMGFRIVPENG